ncbi:hypothetical protein CAC42_6012 [Sphaceloma murrayae]|uniref:Telomerase reverse transcriptase n=1 Tax=Sphaceloma murrayae TaxID=2082308 RepID=A0A2K1QZU0_9PEZI|nr:hypothetical protein CAC42_6012 [Sphaceloma murrayae]
MKRKRAKHGQVAARKRLKVAQSSAAIHEQKLPDASVLRPYYVQLETLRSYLCRQLSKKRAKILDDATRCSDPLSPNSQLRSLLDRTLVGSFDKRSEGSHDIRHGPELKAFSQRRSASVSTASLTPSQQVPLPDIVDYCVWSLFRKHARTSYPPHVLCHGYVRSAAAGQHVPYEIHGLVSHNPNQYVAQFKTKPWTELPQLLGGNADKILVSLLLDCGIFTPLEPLQKNWIQISGVPLTELPQTDVVVEAEPVVPPRKRLARLDAPAPVRKANAIRFVRHRMLYGRPTLNAAGGVTFGQRTIHVLNRCKNLADDAETVHVMKHIFPRRFSLHNVFTSSVTKEESAQPFLDYTLREQEIKRKRLKDEAVRKPTSRDIKIPKRLRGLPTQLVKGIRKRHQTSSYSRLIDHYCPIPSASSNIFSLATPPSQVSAFARSVISHVFPSALWSTSSNSHHIHRSIDRFILLGRYESLTLHTLLQNISPTSIPWLRPPDLSPHLPLSPSDMETRVSLLSELLYYVFDSFLVPLLSSNFYITESSTSRNTLLFFRHDVWLRLSSPALSSLTQRMFEPLTSAQAQTYKARAQLGEGKVRLLPKEAGLRPIVNLKRRAMVRGRDGRMVLGRSVNAALGGAFAVLGCEVRGDARLVGASVFSVEGLGPRLLGFKKGLEGRGWGLGRRRGAGQGLCFVKVDVKGCFDSIPQERLMALLRKVVVAEEYSVGRYAEGKMVRGGRVVWKYKKEAQYSREDGSLSHVLADTGPEREGRVVIDKVVRKHETRRNVLDVLEEHVKRNVVRIGKGSWRQKVGIPQGSVVSSLLCSLFYGHMDGDELGFLDNEECLLVRLIDDFLLITPRLDLAKRFVEVMHGGLAGYGIEIKHEKSMVNFDVMVDGKRVKRLPAVTEFPYCGLSIHTASLHVSADVSRRQSQETRAAVTVEHSKAPGRSFYRKALDTAKLHMHSMLLSKAFNDIARIENNVHQAFKDMGWRCVHYMDSMSTCNQPGGQLLIRTVEDLIDFAYGLMQKRGHGQGQSRDCDHVMGRAQMQRIAYEALLQVFQRRQTKLKVLVEWISMRLSHMRDRKRPTVKGVGKGPQGLNQPRNTSPV